MKRIRAVTTLAVAWTLWSLPAQGRDLKTLHSTRHEARPAEVQIAGARPGLVVLYCTDLSAACKTRRQRLREQGIDFLDKDPKNDPVAGAEYDALHGDGVPLIVLDRRVLHGDDFFEALYPKYHGAASAEARVPSPDAAPATPRVGVEVPSGRVDDVTPDALPGYLSVHPWVVLQFTSPDPNCGFCARGYAPFDRVALEHGGRARFARVQWAPWHAIPKPLREAYGINGLPYLFVFHQGRVVGTLGGMPEPAKAGRWLERQFGQGR